VIAGGPTGPESTTYAGGVAVFDRYAIDAPAVRSHLDAGRRGERSETPAPDDPVFDAAETVSLADVWTALDAAREVASEAGYEPLVLSSRVRGEARETALTHVAAAEEIAATGHPVDPPAVVLSGGEATGTVTGDGSGGPNQEFALGAAIEQADGDLLDEAVVAAVDTDGIDGASDVAGAIVDGETVEDTVAAKSALDENDAGGYLETRDALIETGPTGTNVNDLRVLVVVGNR
jgi:hydroxypyruvate reductase